jgi:hypothetical protein
MNTPLIHMYIYQTTISLNTCAVSNEFLQLNVDTSVSPGR